MKLCAPLIALMIVAATARAGTVHVSTRGSDSGDGTMERPFATLARAARERGNVVVHRGTHVLSETMDLGREDSGVTWTAANGEEVRVSGGPVLSSEAWGTVTDEKVLGRLSEKARGKVLKYEFENDARVELGEYPMTFRGVPAAPELFFNDKRMTVARWPNEGWATIAAIVEPGSMPRYGEKPDRAGVFEYKGDEPSRWDVNAGVWLLGYWCYDWYDEAIRVAAIDREKRRITLAGPAMYGIKQGNPSPRRFKALNVLEELDQPGEFYIDRTARAVYFWPPGEMKGARIVLSMLNGPLVRIKDAEHVTISGIIFEASLGNGVEVSGGSDVRIENCTVRNTREMGIRVTGGTKHRIDGCEVYDNGAGGITMEGGDRKTLTAAGHEVVNNHIHDFSRHQLTGAYALSLGGVGNRAANNLIHDAPHQAVFIGGNDHVFELNVVRNVVTETDDAGAVYKGRNPSCRGNVIRHNFFQDIGSPMGHGTGAIYFDDGDGGDLVFGNVFLRCGDPGGGSFGTIFNHGGHDNRAENNIFIDCKRALGSAPWNDQLWKETIDGGQDCHFQEKLLKEVDITKPPYTTRYPELIGFMDPKPGAPRNNYARNNVLVRCGSVSSGNWKWFDNEIWLTNDDPGFVDASKGIYKLREDAEVFKRLPEFKPIPFEKIGPQRSPASRSSSGAL